MFKIFILLISPILLFASTESSKINLVDISTLDSSIKVQMKYLTKDNFVGAMIDGYLANKCLMTKEASQALVIAQSLALKKQMSLLVHDCYRPQRGVNHFIRWSNDPMDLKTKERYYPNIKKDRLFDLGYIAEKSGHSRGSTIDLTLYDLNSNKALDMGTIYDFLDPLSNTENPKVDQQALGNRQKLVKIMDQAGFKNYSKEWWHYTLKNEPNKTEYLDIVIK